jgi:hypothetical protein
MSSQSGKLNFSNRQALHCDSAWHHAVSSFGDNSLHIHIRLLCIVGWQVLLCATIQTEEHEYYLLHGRIGARRPTSFLRFAEARTLRRRGRPSGGRRSKGEHKNPFYTLRPMAEGGAGLEEVTQKW